MPNTIDANGINIETYPEIVNDIVNGTDSTPGWVTIYGPDVNLDSNAPDGQIVNLLALSKEDMLQFGVGLYNSMNPDKAAGTTAISTTTASSISSAAAAIPRSSRATATTRSIS